MMNRKAFSERFKAAIRAAGLTIDSLAPQIGMSASGIKRWTGNRSDPGLSAIVRAAEVLGVSVEWLATGEGPMRPGETPPPERPSPPPPPSPPAEADDALIAAVAKAIEALYAERGEPLTLSALAPVAARKSAEIAAASADPAERRAMIKLMVVLLRAEMIDIANDRLNAKQRA